MTRIKATRATITLGDINLDVLQFPDGSYHLFINQLNEKLGIKASDSTGKKYLQPLMDKDPKRVNQASVDGIKSNLKTLSLGLVSEAIKIYAELGNQKCIAIAIACLSEALERRADAAFGQAVEYSQLPDNITYVRDVWTSDLTDKILSQKDVVIDIETYGDIATVQFGFRDGTAISADMKTIKNSGDVRETLRRLCELCNGIELGHVVPMDD
jgi:hypothetical protein